MNPEYLQAFWTFVVTIAFGLAAATELVSPKFESMSPDEVDEAIAVYDGMVELNSEDANARALRGCAWLAKQEFDRAIADFDTVIRLTPDSANAYFLRATAWHQQECLDQALADYSAAIRLDPEREQAHFNRAALLVLKRDWVNALADYDESIRLDPNHALAYASRGRIFVENGKLDQAIHDCNDALRLEPTVAAAYDCRGRAWFLKGDCDRAIADFSDAIRLAPSDAKTHFCRGLAWISKQQWDEAIADLSIGLRLDPNDAQAYYHRAHAYNSTNERDQAISDLGEAIRIEPTSASFSVRGWLWQIRGDLDRAISDYSHVLRLEPHNSDVYWRRAIAWANKQEFARALLDALITDELNPRLVPANAIEQFATSSKRIADVQLAERNDENQDAADDAHFAALYRDRGIAHRALQHWDKSVDDFSESIRLDPTSWMTYAYRGRVWLRQSQWDRAIDDFDAALVLNPNNAAAWSLRGSARAARHEWAKACDDFSEAIRLDPHQVRAHAQRGAAWQAQREWDRAIADYDRVTGDVPLYERAPRHRWQDEISVQQVNTNDGAALSTAAINADPDFVNAIRAVANSTAENFPQFNVKLAENPVDRFQFGNPTKTVTALTEATPNAFLPANISSKGIPAGNGVCLDPAYLMCYRNRATCREMQCEWANAMADYRELVRLAPADALAYRRIAWWKATCPDRDCRNGAEAVQCAIQAIERTRGADADNLVTLAAAYAELSDFERAVEFQSQARDLASENGEKEFQTRRQHFDAIEFQWIIDKGDDVPLPDSPLAINAAIKACEQSAWTDAKSIEILADAYANAGQRELAIASQEKAHTLTVALRDKEFLDRLELYRAGTPYRDEHPTK